MQSIGYFALQMNFYIINLKQTENRIDVERGLLISDKLKTCEKKLKLIFQTIQ